MTLTAVQKLRFGYTAALFLSVGTAAYMAYTSVPYFGIIPFYACSVYLLISTALQCASLYFAVSTNDEIGEEKYKKNLVKLAFIFSNTAYVISAIVVMSFSSSTASYFFLYGILPVPTAALFCAYTVSTLVSAFMQYEKTLQLSDTAEFCVKTAMAITLGASFACTHALIQPLIGYILCAVGGFIGSYISQTIGGFITTIYSTEYCLQYLEAYVHIANFVIPLTNRIEIVPQSWKVSTEVQKENIEEGIVVAT